MGLEREEPPLSMVQHQLATVVRTCLSKMGLASTSVRAAMSSIAHISSVIICEQENQGTGRLSDAGGHIAPEWHDRDCTGVCPWCHPELLPSSRTLLLSDCVMDCTSFRDQRKGKRQPRSQAVCCVCNLSTWEIEAGASVYIV